MGSDRMHIHGLHDDLPDHPRIGRHEGRCRFIEIGAVAVNTPIGEAALAQFALAPGLGRRAVLRGLAGLQGGDLRVGARLSLGRQLAFELFHPGCEISILLSGRPFTQ